MTNPKPSENLFRLAAQKKNTTGTPPVWLMRQAGRYHAHYQNLRKRYSFMELCKLPEVACETTMGPIRDFDFDAAILFSDLLFPLEVMGTGLEYGDAGPKLGWHIKSAADVGRLRSGPELVSHLQFQGDAMKLIRRTLPAHKGLLGFVGGPLTLFFYAVSGSHRGDLSDARAALTDGRWEPFLEKLIPLLVENMLLQARAGADCVALLDTCGGEISPDLYGKLVVPANQKVLEAFKRGAPDTLVTYYSKGTNADYWRHLVGLPIHCLGIDWHNDLAATLRDWGQHWAIQGNVDPEWMFLPWPELETKLRAVFAQVAKLPASARAGWICGLGHGVLPKTPEENVRRFVQLVREVFA
ncbi:MAG: uroporphyrinogen decarboxylase family protein [Bacteriovoracia bacterium]